MPQKKKQKNIQANHINTVEVEKAVEQLGIAESKTLTRPHRSKAVLVMLFFVISACVAVAYGAMQYIKNSGLLVDALPSDTQIYLRLDLPTKNTLEERLFFWRENPSEEVVRLYQNIDLIHWNKVNFAKHLLPLMRRRIEFAQFSDSTVVLQTTLTDVEAWNTLVGASANTAFGTLSSVGGLVTIRGGQERYFWTVRGKTLSITNKPDNIVAPGDGGFGASTLKKGVGSLYISSQETVEAFVGTDIARQLSSIQYPLMATMGHNGDVLALNIPQQQPSEDHNALGFPLVEIPNKDILLAQSADSGRDLEAWIKYIASYNDSYAHKIAQIRSIASSFYNIHTEPNFSQLQDVELIAAIQAPDGIGDPDVPWLIMGTARNDVQNEVLGEYFENIAKSLFAATHPVSETYTLKDGTQLTELRADIAGIEWQEVAWSIGDHSFIIKALRGQGEEQGIYVSAIPSVGVVITNSLELMDPVVSQVAKYIPADTPDTLVYPLNKGCIAPYPIQVSLTIPAKTTTENILVNDLIRTFRIMTYSNNSIGLCALMR